MCLVIWQRQIPVLGLISVFLHDLPLGHLLLKCPKDEYLPQGPLLVPPAGTSALYTGHFPQTPPTSEGAAFTCLMNMVSLLQALLSDLCPL